MIIIAAVCDLAVPDPGGPDRVPEVPLERPVEEDEEDNQKLTRKDDIGYYLRV